MADPYRVLADIEALLEDAGVDVETSKAVRDGEETVAALRLRLDGDEDVPHARGGSDVAPTTADAAEDSAGDEPSETVACEHCDREFGTEHGKNIHVAHTHDADDEDQDGHEADQDGDDERLDLSEYRRSLTEDDVVDAVAGETTVTEAAAALELEPGAARDLLGELGLLQSIAPGSAGPTPADVRAAFDDQEVVGGA